MIFIDHWTICVTILTRLPLHMQGSTQVYVTNKTNVTWTDANNTCTLAQPDIEYFSDRERLDINTGLILNGNEPWVGMYHALISVQYLGCWRRSYLVNRTIKDMVTRADVGICYTACRSRFFGIVRSGHCTCLDSLDTATAAEWSRCYRACSGIACGSRYSHMSVYRTAKTTSPCPNSSMCLALRKNFTTEWRNCFDKNVDGIICTYDNESAYEIKKWKGGDWFNQTKTCTGHGNFNRDEMHTEVRKLEHDQVYWTMTVGMSTIYKASEDVPAHMKPLKFGYAQRDGNFFRLRFRDDASGSSAICQRTANKTTTRDKEVDTPEDMKGLYIWLSIGLILFVAGVGMVAVFVLFRRKYRKTATARNGHSPTNVAYNDGAQTSNEILFSSDDADNFE